MSTPERSLREQSGEFMGTKCPACGHQFGRIIPDQKAQTTNVYELGFKDGLDTAKACFRELVVFLRDRIENWKGTEMNSLALKFEALLGKIGAP